MRLFDAKYSKILKIIIMLLPDTIHPENTIYYNGGIVLQVLQKDKVLKLLDLYEKVRQSKNMTFQVFVLCLDWLYLLNVAQINHNNEVVLCS